MANKKAYFYEVKLYSMNDDYQEYNMLPAMIIEAINTRSIEQDGFRTLDITLEGDALHTMMDVFNYKTTGLFCRLSKQRSKNNFIQREYETLRQDEIFPGVAEGERGIEQYTYGYLNYQTCIFTIVTSKGAPGARAFSDFIIKHCNGYYIKLIEVPNPNAIETIYLGEDPEISRIMIEVPTPPAEVLQQIFEWNDREVLDVISQRSTTVAIEIKPPERQKITDNDDDSRKLIDCIRNHVQRYRKAKIRAKTRDIKAQDYSFHEEYFSYPIDITHYRIENYNRIYYSVPELVEIYRQNIITAYRENEEILTTITGR